MFYIGCPMWGYKAWVGPGKLFPPRTPQSEFLRIYSRQLSTVEGNTTFYATPSEETIARWRQETPSTFRFCPKISRSISHTLPLDQSKDETLRFVARMRGLGEQLGPMFLQLPPSFSPAQFAQLESFLQFWPTDTRLAVEVRHPDFFAEPHASRLEALLKQHNVGFVIMDTRPIRVGPDQEQQVLQARERKPDLPLRISVTTDFAFVRYIGHPRMEENEPFLQQWVRQTGQWLAQGLTLYAFCHCPYEEHSPGICAEWYQRVRTTLPALLPPMAWQPGEKDASGPRQARLF
ncbi:MAG TPA: DUF72 domain-containing protein [Ktedonosporobacter sp.]|jgi:uncharacterized protein YecE (DUF72 family)|nr:DUF72 domain-containing protein [Ktedonosporobacter sp.]